MFKRAAAAVLIVLIGVTLLITSSNEGPSDERPTSPVERKAVRIQEQLAAAPNDERLLLRTMRAWIRAGADRIEQLDATAKPISVPPVASEDYMVGLQAWNKYLRQTDGEPSRALAEMASGTYFQLVEIGSKDPEEATANSAGAVEAQRIACAREPNLYTLSNLASYQYFNGEFAAGDRAARKAAKDAVNPGGIKPAEVIGQLNEYKERGEKFLGRVKQGFTTLEETGEEELETPIKGYGAPAGLNGYEPGTGPS